jgi:tetratricopeptide (TPR) repeat protein
MAREPAEGAVAVIGEAGAGKSAVARQIATVAEADGLTPVLAAPASGAPDAGALVIAGIISQLGGTVRPANGWQAATQQAGGLLRAGGDQIVVVCDEASSWSSGGGHFGRRAEDVVELLLGPNASWPAIVCDQAASGRRTVRLPSPDVGTLHRADEWGVFAEAAASVALRPGAQQFDTHLKQRLAAAILAWSPTTDRLATQTPDLARQLAQTLASRRHGLRLWAVWQRLALARLDVDLPLLTVLGATDLSPLAEGTLRQVLLDGAGRLHDALRRIPEERPVDPEMPAGGSQDTHEKLYEYHLERFGTLANANDPRAGEHGAEALHHAGELADQERIDLVRVDLSDQLNAMGTRLVELHGDHESAASVFFRAVQIDERDGYARHGRARSLDTLGQDADAVIEEYDRAIDLEPTEPSWHAHRVGLLADLGLLDDARRAWAVAESAVLGAGEDVAVYEEMHAATAAGLIALGELPFAEYVLDGVPGWARNAEHRRLENVLAGRLAAEEDGSVVPAPRSGQAWWEGSPAVLATRDTNGRRLVRWAAGRVDHVDADGVHVHLAEVGSGETNPQLGWSIITPEAWRARALDDIAADEVRRGQFVEIGRYQSDGDEARTAIRIVPLPRLPEGSHRPLSPSRWTRP